MRALVTGSSGFLGRHFVRHLSEQGWQVSAIDTAHPESPRDARDVFRRWSGPWDLVVHCAAIVNGRQTIERRPMDQVIDFEMDAAMFRWITQVEARQVVYFSSSAAYPISLQTGQPRSLQESDIVLSQPKQPDALYGWTKLIGEVLADHARQSGQNVLVVRPFSGYGEDQDDCYPFPAIIQRAVERQDPFVVWGSGQQVRDFIHVDDIVGAVMAFIEAGVSGPVNIGTGIPTTMKELALIAAAQCGYTPKVTPLTHEPEGVMFRVADPTEMLRYYQPQISLSAGVSRAIDYFRSR